MLISLGSQKCGNTYESCIGDPSQPLGTHVVIIIIVVSIIFAIVVGGCSYYCRVQRIKQARAQFARQMRDLTAQSQARCIYYISSGPSIGTQSPIQETPTPSYEQVVKETMRN
jgi:hypothetical protein